MKKLKVRIPENLQAWINAREQYRLTHLHIQMARELGLNPRSFAKMSSNPDEPWKIPLPQFLEQLYLKRFEKPAPENVISIEDHARQAAIKKAARKAANAVDPERQARREAAKAALRQSRYRPEANADAVPETVLDTNVDAAADQLSMDGPPEAEGPEAAVVTPELVIETVVTALPEHAVSSDIH